MPKPQSQGLNVADPVVIVEAARSPFGAPGGQLSQWHPAAMASLTLSELVGRAGADLSTIDSLILGCTSQVGAQSQNIARAAALGAGLPENVSAISIDAQHASGLEAIRLAAGSLPSGRLAIAGGSEHMSQVPLGRVAVDERYGAAFGPEVSGRYRAEGGLQPPGVVAERVARRASLTPTELAAYAAESKRRFLVAQKNGLFDGELVAWPSGLGQAISRDETPEDSRNSSSRNSYSGVRTDPDLLTPCFLTGGLLTAAMVAPPADGTAVLLLAHDSTARRLGLRRRATILGFASAGANPIDGSVAAIEATARLLAETSLEIAEIDVFEIHEAFACVPLAWCQAFSVAVGRCNVSGGALAVGDPIGAGAAKLVLGALSQLERNGQRYGLAVSDGASGHASAALIERCVD